MEKSKEYSHALLQQIANILSVSVEQLLADCSTPETAAETDECFHLWGQLRTPAGRIRALEALRIIVDEES